MALKVTHDVELYEVGGGILSIALWDGTTPPEALDYFDVGNCLEFSYELAIETLTHKSFRGSRRVTDRKVIIETGYKLKFKLDEPSIKNLAIYTKGVIDGTKIHALQAGLQEYAVKFVSDNYTGEGKTYEFWRCDLKAAGS